MSEDGGVPVVVGGGHMDGRKYAVKVGVGECEGLASGSTHILPIDFCL